MTWLCFGYALAFGEHGSLGYFAGTSHFFALDISMKTTAWPMWFFQWAFASATCTIVSGAGAERCSFRGYLLSTMLLSTFVCTSPPQASSVKLLLLLAPYASSNLDPLLRSMRGTLGVVRRSLAGQRESLGHQILRLRWFRSRPHGGG